MRVVLCIIPCGLCVTFDDGSAYPAMVRKLTLNGGQVRH